MWGSLLEARCRPCFTSSLRLIVSRNCEDFVKENCVNFFNRGSKRQTVFACFTASKWRTLPYSGRFSKTLRKQRGLTRVYFSWKGQPLLRRDQRETGVASHSAADNANFRMGGVGYIFWKIGMRSSESPNITFKNHLLNSSFFGDSSWSG